MIIGSSFDLLVTKLSDMRLFLALAFVAVASAIPMPADHQFAEISIAPLIIPAEVAEAFRKDLEINRPINYIESSDAKEFDDASLVHFVDVADASPVDEIEPSAVKFVDAPINEESESPVEYVKIVYSLPSAYADADFVVIPVRFADSSLEEEIAPVPVKFFDAPVPVEAVADLSEDVEALAPTAVKFVDAPLEEVAPTAVKFVNAPLEEVAPTAVKFVDAPLEEEVAPIEAEAEDSIRIAHVNEDAEVIAPTAVKFVNAPLEEEVAPTAVKFVDAPFEEVAPTAVKFVDAPLEEVAPTAVKFVDAPFEEEVDAVEAEVVAPTAVKFVDAPLEEEAAPIEEAVESVRIAEVIAPTPVKFVDAPFEGEAVLSDVKFVDAPLYEAESIDGPEFHNLPFKLQNPLLR